MFNLKFKPKANLMVVQTEKGKLSEEVAFKRKLSYTEDAHARQYLIYCGNF